MAWDEIPRTSTRPDPDWSWFHVPQDAAHIKWEQQDDGTSELVIYVRNISQLVLDMAGY